MLEMLKSVLVVALLCSCTGPALAGRVGNGNDLALDYSLGDEAARRELAADATGKLFFFRYLKVTTLDRVTTNQRKHVTIAAVEPASDMLVTFTASKPVSLRRLREQEIAVGNGIAVTGRLREIAASPPRIRLDPAIVKHKDRLRPAVGKELLHEVNPEARYGTETKTGEDVIINRETQYDN